MEPFRYHVYVCDQRKAEGMPCCSARGSGRVLDALRGEIAKRGLLNEVQVTVTGSLGMCERGPNLVVYPEGMWYSGVQPEDVPEIVESHFIKGTVVARLSNTDAADLAAEIQGNREKFMAAMRAKDAAGALPDELQQTIRGFQESRVILTALELDAFTAVGEGATAAEAASRMTTDARATAMLLDALTAMNLLVKHDGRYRNTAVSGRYFVAGSRDDARAGLLHTANLWATWSNLTECVRTGTAVGSPDVEHRDAEWKRSFIAAMDRGAREQAALVARAVGTEGVKRMLDVGGGSGAYAIAFATAGAHVHADVFDLADVLPLTEEYIARSSLSDRVHARAGDLRRDRFGEGYDVVLVSSICHMLGEEENRDLIARCHAAINPGGRIVIKDFLLQPDKAGPKFAALFSLNMLVGTRSGASYSEQEYARWLAAAGFQDVRRVPLPGPAGLIVARR
jgi:(2Fe-2S) ferredoxin/2-polyprenyl-3-methyl-5-hydroxy-6-metoxy-1,4-benzoquinol methylase